MVIRKLLHQNFAEKKDTKLQPSITNIMPQTFLYTNLFPPKCWVQNSAKYCPKKWPKFYGKNRVKMYKNDQFVSQELKIDNLLFSILKIAIFRFLKRPTKHLFITIYYFVYHPAGCHLIKNKIDNKYIFNKK